MTDAIRSCEVVRVEGGRRERARDAVAVEAPLEIRLDGEPFAVIMRTPGADARPLRTGFLLTEGIIDRASDVGAIACTGDEAVLDVRLAGAVGARLPALLASRRQVTMNSSCGLCGRSTLASLDRGLLSDRGGLAAARPACCWPCRARSAARSTRSPRPADCTRPDCSIARAGSMPWRRTSGATMPWTSCSAACCGPADGRWTDAVLFVSGRLSFEIVQKAQIGGIPVVGAVSAPSSLAVDSASESGMTLVGLCATAGCNVYTHPGRIGGP